MAEKKGVLILSNGDKYHGYLFGSIRRGIGEVVFQTGMVGYVESLTDPSYKSQLLILTYPIVGNYGVPQRKVKDQWDLEKYFESDRIYPSGLIVNEYSTEFSNCAAESPLGDWLKDEGIVGIYGIDTRQLTKFIRESGCMMGIILPIENDETVNFSLITNPDLFNDVNDNHLALEVSQRSTRTYNSASEINICIIDCGIKYNQIRCFCKYGAKVTVVHLESDVDPKDYDALFVSNGPGNPEKCTKTICTIKRWLKSEKPFFGICLGHQLLSLSIGCRTYKMKYGNRGHNQPCTHIPTKVCFMTSQNHGFAVESESIPSGWRELFYNENDKSNEGIIHDSLPFMSVQFHPEHMSGPMDTEFMFSLFIDTVKDYKVGNIKLNLNERLTRHLTYTQKPYEIELMALKQNKPKKVLILGSGGLSIGQAGEFDYSGSQALKALQEEGVQTVLVNPNIATVQTTTKMADKSYMLPITKEYVTEVIKMERPDGIYLSFGGQTGLNCGVELEESGILKEYNVMVLGTPVQTIKWTEDRQVFADKLEEIDEKVAPSISAYSVKEVIEAANKLGYPVMVRAAFTLGGLGSGFASNASELYELVTVAFAHTSQVLVDKSLRGWKEIEYEVVRDAYDNCITVCNMENIDPLGIHTGESVVVSPSQTLSNYEYYMLRKCAIKVVRHLGVVGECNIQYALDPESHKYYIIEVNARLSRSSALASKATGYPLAYVAAKLGLGISLPSLKNSVTKCTTACFEPSLDYCVVKVPRWDLSKFTKVCNKISTQMKSVGEVMAIGRSFEEAFQKALRMVDEKYNGFDPYVEKFVEEESLSSPTDRRMLVLANALKQNVTVKRIYELTKIDKWFLYKFSKIIKYLTKLEECNINNLDSKVLLQAKQLGFSDKQIALASKGTEINIRSIRQKYNIKPKIHQIDTVSAEWPCSTNYLYLSYSGIKNDINIEGGYIMVLGSGVYRIGSSVEFDWCAVQCIKKLRETHKTIMVNCNPETVSTDYDMCDHLYFEEISLETISEIYSIEQPDGVIVSMGGQLPNNIAMGLHREKIPILGTSPVCIDNAENRFKFSRMLDSIKINQPLWKELTDYESAFLFARQVGYPCLVRPSYVLSGAAMNVAFSESDLNEYLNQATSVNKDHPVVISKFIEDAKEIDVDGVACGGKLVKWAVSEHVENAGVHSGDATLVTPPDDINQETLMKIRKIAIEVARELKVTGPFNMQLIAKDNNLLVIECNLRVSRSFPFVSKALGCNLIGVATRAIMDQMQIEEKEDEFLAGTPGKYGVKSPVFSFSRLPGADVLLGVEMSSTGEVACFGTTRYDAFLKAHLSQGGIIPRKSSSILLSIGSYKHKRELMNSVVTLHELGYKLLGSIGTADFYKENGVDIKSVDWMNESNNGGSDNVGDISQLISENKIDVMINLPKRNSGLRRATAMNTQGYRNRRMAIEHGVTLITNVKIVKLWTSALRRRNNSLAIGPTYLVDPSIDCITSQRIVRLPGLIDVHVHTRDPGQTHKEDWTSVSKAALAGGITTILAMPNTNPSVVDFKTLKATNERASAFSLVNFGLYMGASETNYELWSNGSKVNQSTLIDQAIGLKMYLNDTFTTLKLTNLDAWRRHIETFPERLPICCHAEGQALSSVILFAHLSKRAIHICHVSGRQEIEIIRDAKLAGINITCEVAPHHLFLHDNSFFPKSSMKKVKPHLKTVDDCKALWDNMDIIDCFATDHAPHTLEEKTQENAPPGFPGLETMLPLLLDACNQDKLSINQIIEKLSTNPRRIFNLPVEDPSTWVEVDLNETWIVGEGKKRFETKCGWSPFENWKLKGRVKRVVLNGQLVYVDGKFLVGPGFGKNVIDLPKRPPLFTNKVNKRTRLSSSINVVIEDDLSSRMLTGDMYDNDYFQFVAKQIASQTQPTSPAHGTTGASNISSQSTPVPVTMATVIAKPPSPRKIIRNPTHLYDYVTYYKELSGHNLISVQQVDKASLNHLLNLAHSFFVTRSSMTVRNDSSSLIARGKVLALLFYEPSTRTSYSFAAAMQRLGGSVLPFDEAASSVKKGESLEDSVRMISAYSHAMVLRHSKMGIMKSVVDIASCPLINAGDGAGEHPTQALLDVFTIREEFGTVNNLTICLAGDLLNGRTVHSLAKLLCLYNVQLIYVPYSEELCIPSNIEEFIRRAGIPQRTLPTLESALKDADVIYMTRLQKERLDGFSTSKKQLIKKSASKLCITPELMQSAKPKAIVMHPLPRCEEISTAFDLDPRAAYFRQAEYGLYVRMALLATILSTPQ